MEKVGGEEREMELCMHPSCKGCWRELLSLQPREQPPQSGVSLSKLPLNTDHSKASCQNITSWYLQSPRWAQRPSQLADTHCFWTERWVCFPSCHCEILQFGELREGKATPHTHTKRHSFEFCFLPLHQHHAPGTRPLPAPPLCHKPDSKQSHKGALFSGSLGAWPISVGLGSLQNPGRRQLLGRGPRVEPLPVPPEGHGWQRQHLHLSQGLFWQKTCSRLSAIHVRFNTILCNMVSGYTQRWASLRCWTTGTWESSDIFLGKWHGRGWKGPRCMGGVISRQEKREIWSKGSNIGLFVLPLKGKWCFLFAMYFYTSKFPLSVKKNQMAQKDLDEPWMCIIKWKQWAIKSHIIWFQL